MKNYTKYFWGLIVLVFTTVLVQAQTMAPQISVSNGQEDLGFNSCMDQSESEYEITIKGLPNEEPGKTVCKVVGGTIVTVNGEPAISLEKWDNTKGRFMYVEVMRPQWKELSHNSLATSHTFKIRIRWDHRKYISAGFGSYALEVEHPYISENEEKVVFVRQIPVEKVYDRTSSQQPLVTLSLPEGAKMVTYTGYVQSDKMTMRVEKMRAITGLEKTQGSIVAIAHPTQDSKIKWFVDDFNQNQAQMDGNKLTLQKMLHPQLANNKKGFPVLQYISLQTQSACYGERIETFLLIDLPKKMSTHLTQTLELE